MTFKKNPIFQFILLVCLLCSCVQKTGEFESEYEEYDGPDKAMEMEFKRTKDPATGTVPRERLMGALAYTDSLKKTLPFQLVAGYGNWTERGPNSDVVGASNGNTRANSGKASGRIRSMLVDANDATGNTVFVGAVDGGLWKTTDITATSPTWTLINDFFVNMAITSICQDPTNAQTMYFATGEGFFNADAVRGTGVWKSTDGGTTWTQLAATTAYLRGTKIVCDAAGNIYLGDRNTGLLRSVNGGTSWTNITPAGAAGLLTIADIETSSTGRLHVTIGLVFNTTSYYFYTDNPSTTNTTTSAANWISPTTPFPTTTTDRIELACSGNTLFALPSNSTTNNVATIYKSTDGGANWAATGGQPASATWAGGQGWYALGAAIDPANANNVIVGGLEPYRTTDGGTSWTRIARWVGTVGQYVHADIHYINIYGSNRVLFGCDGGVHYSSDLGTNIRDRNTGLRIKQFYSCAIHPSTTNYFLAGAQDNGSHSFSTAGLGTTTEVSGGDGGFVHIDQDEPLFQYTSYIFNDYFRSINGGTTWSSVTLNSSTGQFINPTDYDNTANIMYCGNTAGTYLRWTDPQTGATNASVSITALNGNSVSAVTVSPYTNNRVYFGTENDAGSTRLCYVDNAHSTASGSAGTNISTGLPTNVYTSCIVTGTNDNNLMVCYSNYGVQQIWVSTNGGTNWTNIDGDLPDMPVRWCMFVPGSNTKAFIATEAGVYLTQFINGASTAWIPSPTFPTVRTDMLQYRASDGLIAAATHGRGLWTQPYYSILPATNFLLRGGWNGSKVALQWDYTPLAAGATLDVELSADATNFIKIGSLSATASKQYNFSHIPNANNVFYRIRSNEANGVIKYSNTVKLFKNGAGTGLEIISLYPNPAERELNFGFSTEKGKLVYSITATDGRLMLRKEEELQFTGNYVRTINITGIAAGNYVLTISNGKQKISRQFIKR